MNNGRHEQETTNSSEAAPQTDTTRRRLLGAGAMGLAVGALAGTSVLHGADAVAQTNPSAAPAASSGREITYDGGDDKIKAYLAKPAGTVQDRGAAVIVIPEIWGLNDHMRDLARRFAAQGFTALAPDLFRGESPPKLEGNNFKPLLDFLGNIPDSRMVGDLEAAIVHLNGQGSARVGTVGFCMGGLYSYLLATKSSRLNAAVDFYGRIVYPETNAKKPESPINLAPRLKCPLLCHFGETDGSIPIADVEALRERLKGAAHPWKVNIYPGVGHAFFNDTRPSYDKAAANDAWQETLEFFKKHLVVPKA